MSPQLQTAAALLIVAAAASWLIVRSVARRKNPGCAGDCGCASEGLRAKAVQREKEG